MDITQSRALLGGLSPQQFMRRHWQKKPLLVRQALPDFKPLLTRVELFQLAAQERVESRLIVQKGGGWSMKHGPFGRRSLPALAEPGWSLLVQGVDQHDRRAHQLLQNFRFVPDARLDDLMISFATAAGGVGPHFDSYDVFLLQASGRRRWRIGLQKDLSLQSGVPLKILQNFKPTEEFVLEAGDMLYLPPLYAHDGVAEAVTGPNGKAAECMTYSIGFRAPARAELAAEILQRLAEYCGDEGAHSKPDPRRFYRDPAQPATPTPAALPAELTAYAQQAIQAALKDPLAVPCALGEYLTEPKPSVWFDEPSSHGSGGNEAGVRLDRRTRMMYDLHHIFINGESYLAKGADAGFMRRLADQRLLTARELRRASRPALELLKEWHEAGWLEFAAESSAT